VDGAALEAEIDVQGKQGYGLNYAPHPRYILSPLHAFARYACYRSLPSTRHFNRMVPIPRVSTMHTRYAPYALAPLPARYACYRSLPSRDISRERFPPVCVPTTRSCFFPHHEGKGMLAPPRPGMEAGAREAGG
jgi:hypothetical protein